MAQSSMSYVVAVSNNITVKPATDQFSVCFSNVLICEILDLKECILYLFTMTVDTCMGGLNVSLCMRFIWMPVQEQCN